jgi:hypothetical protein
MSDKGFPPRRDLLSTSTSSAKLIVLLVSSLALSAAITLYGFTSPSIRTNTPPLNAQEILDKCRSLNTRTGPHSDFPSRAFSEQFDHHENDTLIVNATIFTGAKNGTEVLKGDILISKGVIKALGKDIRSDGRKHSKIVDVKGAWVTPGLGKALHYSQCACCHNLTCRSQHLFAPRCLEQPCHSRYYVSLFPDV